jgi:glycosyltransferase involved in cell wall biosynthesis
MRIGLDLSPLTHPHPPGVTRVARELSQLLIKSERFEFVEVRPETGRDLRSWRQAELPAIAARDGLDGIHSFVSAFAWRGPGLRVHTVHELPWRHGVKENSDWRHRFWASLGVRRADRTLSATEVVKEELASGWLVPAKKLRVCPWGAGSPFTADPPLDVIDEVVPGRLRLPEDPFFLAPGAVRAKKNLAALLHGFARAHAAGLRAQLVITGPDTADLRRDLGLVSKLGLARWVSTPGELSDEDLASLYRLCAGTCVLSRSEGFALPVAEALACGAPTIISAGGSAAEVAGPAGICVNPEDPDSIADALRRAIDEESALRGPALARAKEFTWERCAARIEEVWGELA